ncbi:S9 family peptidase [Thalassotalea litorea]|uniref:S9 family peptidase n=1 Tax=Thalassotalea litorea TaxID=2020715 RepID=A0A5R9IMK1_9GAMM|nr:S9 family peptidase [Thalassotalea litorea]TLU66784.1 S9 family peptidase [Thalassotalea litorea]
MKISDFTYLHLFGLLLALTLSIPSSAASIAPPIEAFSSTPDVANVTLSPDGRYLASIVKVTGESSGSVVSIVDIDTQSTLHSMFTDNNKYVLTSLFWANNEVLLVTAKFPAFRGNTPSDEWRTYQVHAKTGENKTIIPKHLGRKLRYTPQIQTRVVDLLPDDKEHILVALAGTRAQIETSIYKIKLGFYGDNDFETLQQPIDGVRDWISDNQHNIRIGIKVDGTNFDIIERKDALQPFRTLWSYEAFSDKKIMPLGFANNPDILYVLALHQGKDALFKVNIQDPKLQLQLVFANASYDVSGQLRRDPTTSNVIGIGNHYWDSHISRLQSSVDAVLLNTNNVLLGISKDANRYLVYSSSAQESGTYYLGDRKAKYLKAVAHKYLALPPEKLSPRTEISFKARDGLTIKGYLTLPRDKFAGKLPTIVFPHGGPISRETSGFDYWSQFLASRGYAVLQIDFRGSSGYGHDFMMRGLKQWGKAMQDDIEDGTRWLISQNIAAADKICILGASYGGYAALMGTIKTPELYQCAVSFAGITDVEMLVKYSRRYRNSQLVEKQIGNDYQALWNISPVKHAQKINTPILLLHGEYDRTVRYRHSEIMARELNSHNKVVQFVTLDKGDHFLSISDNRQKAFQAIEAFLSKYLSPSSG